MSDYCGSKDMAIVRVCKDIRLLGKCGEMAIVRIGKGVILLGKCD